MSKIQLRNKFIKAFPSIEAQNQVISECEHLFTLQEDQAVAYLWKRYIEANEPSEDANSSNFKLLAWRELRSQYTITHPGFPRVYIPDACKQSYDAFAEVNPIVAVVVTNVAMTYIKQNIILVDRTLFLLNSDKEANYFGGIRELGFSYAESTVLKSFIKQIRDIFDNLCKHYQNLDISEEELPFTLSPQDENTETTVQSETVQTEIEEHIEEKVELTPDPLAFTILQNRQAIEEFCKATASIESLGFNPEELLAKKEVIKNFLEIVDKL